MIILQLLLTADYTNYPEGGTRTGSSWCSGNLTPTTYVQLFRSAISVHFDLVQPGIPSNSVRNTAILTSFPRDSNGRAQVSIFVQGPLLLLGDEGLGEGRVCHNAKDLYPTADNHDIEIYPSRK